MMNRFIAFLTAVILCLTMLFSVVSNASVDDTLYRPSFMRLRVLGITEGDMKDANSFITRGEFVSLVLKTMNADTLSGDLAQVFSDVSINHPYAGQISAAYKLGIINGVTGTQFYPDENITMLHGLKMVVAALGYNPMALSQGGYPAGYLAVSNRYSLLNGVDGEYDISMTKGQAYRLLDNSLKIPLMKMVNFGDNPEYVIAGTKSRPEECFLMNHHKISYKDVVITKVDDITHRFTARDNLGVYESYIASPEIKLSGILNAAVELWLNSDDIVVAIIVKSNTEIHYGVIEYVNSDKEKQEIYDVSQIKSLVLNGNSKSLRTKENYSFYWNEVLETSGKRSLREKFAVITEESGVVSSINVYTLVQGGIFESASTYDLTYIEGRGTKAMLRDLDEYEKCLAVEDGDVKELSEITVGAYFDYYINKDTKTLVICATTRVVTGLYTSYSLDANDSAIEIDSVYYPLEYTDKVNLFIPAQKAGRYEYATPQRLGDMIGMTVTAVFDYKGYIKYLKTDESVNPSEITGILCQHGKENKLDENMSFEVYTEQGQLKRYVVLEKRVNSYAASDPDVYVSVSDAYSKEKSYEGEGLFRFGLNPNGEITYIKKYELRNYKMASRESFENNDIPQLRVKDENGNDIYTYLDITKFFWLGDINGKFTPLLLDWQSIKGSDVEGDFTIRLTRNIKLPQPEFMLLPNQYDDGSKFYVQTSSKTLVLNRIKDIGEDTFKLEFASSDEPIYIKKEDYHRELKSNSIVSFDEFIKADGTKYYKFTYFYDLEEMATVPAGNGIYFCPSLYDMEDFYFKVDENQEYLQSNRYGASVYKRGAAGQWRQSSLSELRLGMSVYYFQMWKEINMFFILE